MDYLERITGTISAKGKEAAQKAKDMADIASLKSQISTCENVIKKNYQEIGKLYYEEYAKQEDAPYEKQRKAITNARLAIFELEEKIAAIKGQSIL